VLKPAPDLEPTTYETLWWGDDAVDREASEPQIVEWCTTGEADKLTMRAGVEPSPITYRALTVRELAQIPILDGSSGTMASRCYEASRYGLVSIKGLKLHHSRHNGVRGLAESALDLLTGFQAHIPIMSCHQEWLTIEGYEFQADHPDQRLLTDLAQWVGGLILARTFRAFGGPA
jgi:hypothetical protein